MGYDSIAKSYRARLHTIDSILRKALRQDEWKDGQPTIYCESENRRVSKKGYSGRIGHLRRDWPNQ
jgi:hypothetical protein